MGEDIDGFTLGDNPSDGETLCTGCWDASNWDLKADNDIPAGEPVYFRRTSYEYEEFNAYCTRCATDFDAGLRSLAVGEG